MNSWVYNMLTFEVTQQTLETRFTLQHVLKMWLKLPKHSAGPGNIYVEIFCVRNPHTQHPLLIF